MTDNKHVYVDDNGNEQSCNMTCDHCDLEFIGDELNDNGETIYCNDCINEGWNEFLNLTGYAKAVNNG